MVKVKKGKRCPYCGRWYSRYLCIDALVIKNQRILLVKRKKEGVEGGRWALPGGHLNWEETTEEGVLRELKEETGVEGEVKNLVGVYSNPKRDKNGSQNVALVYLVKPLKQTKSFDKKEIEKFDWFDFDKLPSNIAFDHRQIIEDYLKTAKNSS